MYMFILLYFIIVLLLLLLLIDKEIQNKLHFLQVFFVFFAVEEIKVVK
jgi:hypothetical protein